MIIFDISGSIREGIWKYAESTPDYTCESRSASEGTFFFEIFHGFNSQTGTYLETTAHINGYSGNRLINDVPVSELVNIPCRVLHIDRESVNAKSGKIDSDDIENAVRDMVIPDGCALLFESGWHDWYSPDFIAKAPYLSRNAMVKLLSMRPVLIGSDTPAWQKYENVFDLFAATNTLLLAPLVNLPEIDGKDCRLTVLPVSIENTCCAPARAVITENEQ